MEIGTCPNIEVGIDMMDKSPFFIRPYHVREEDKKVIDKEMKHLCYLGILKERFLPYSSPVMLISQKLTQDKKVVTDFRYLNVRIAKNNLVYPLDRDTFLVLGNSKCAVLSVLDLKHAFHSLRLSDDSKRYCSILPYFGSASYIYQRMPMGIKYFPSSCRSLVFSGTVHWFEGRQAFIHYCGLHHEVHSSGWKLVFLPNQCTVPENTKLLQD